jgi:hypothetical protein
MNIVRALVIEKIDWRKVLSVRSTLAGRGLFARKLFRKRQVIGHMTGTLIAGDDYDPDYVVDMGDHGVLDPHAPFRFLNHSCEPNCELLEWETEDAARPAESAIRCLCGAPTCRGWVVDAGELERVKRRAARGRRRN